MSGSDSPTFFHGQPWSSWIERIGRDKPLSDDESEVEPTSSVTRLSVDDIDLYGFCPERDSFYGVVCEICNAIVKPQALIQHMETRHPSGMVNLPPPSNPITKSPMKTPYCKLSKLKKSHSTSQLQVNHASIKRSGDHDNIQSTISLSAPQSPLETLSGHSSFCNTVVSSSPNKSPVTVSQTKRKRIKADRSLLKDREYDPDKHCGVWNEETSKPCTRSLTCKAHTVSLRRTVSGRSKAFDKLLAEHRAAKELPARPAKFTVTGTVTVSSDVTNLKSLSSNTPLSTTETDTPSSPPVLSLPDTYPLPQTKLEDDFANEELRLESTLAKSTASTTGMTTSISVVLPSLSPRSSMTEESPVAMLLPVSSSSTIQMGTPLMPVRPPIVSMALETNAPMEIDSVNSSIYSPISMYKDNSHLVLQLPRSSNSTQQSVSRNYQTQTSVSVLNIFNPTEHLDFQRSQINGKNDYNEDNQNNSISRQVKRSKHDYCPEFSTAIQLEATTTSSPYPHFEDISWSNCHPEPLAVSRWLRITSSRKQYNFNIH